MYQLKLRLMYCYHWPSYYFKDCMNHINNGPYRLLKKHPTANQSQDTKAIKGSERQQVYT